MSSLTTGKLPTLALMPKERGDPACTTTDSSVVDVEVSDEALMASIAAGDKEALAWLFRRHAGIVRGVAYKVLRDSSEADDLLQDIFVLVHRLCRTFDPAKASARFWILQMTYRRAISRRRYLTSRHFYTRMDLDEETEGGIDFGPKSWRHDDPIDRMIGQETLQEIFKTLSEDQQKTLRLFFFDGYNFEEIAAALGQTAGNVSHHYYRGLEKLRRQMQALGGKLQPKRAL